MSKGNLIIVIIALFSIFPTPACSSGTSASAVNSPLIGVWGQESANANGKKYTFIFFDNGTFAIKDSRSSSWNGGRYSIYDNVLMLVEIGSGDSETQTLYTFSVSGNTLTLSGDGIYKRTKLPLK